MTTAPDAVRATQDPRDVARALVSSPLPLPTTTRLLLLGLVACAGASFTTWWWLVLGRGNWPGAHVGCLPAASAAPDAVLDRFTGCVYDVRLAQSAVVLCGPLALLALALLWRAVGRRRARVDLGSRVVPVGPTVPVAVLRGPVGPVGRDGPGDRWATP
ncbi:hypothetical protein [Streptomyces sp. NPDC059861]|uniref:hypothetical protein n=1 Tax=Streptomyces sp. NPDC059861 TaxID=3346974 RepID=UPI00365883B9